MTVGEYLRKRRECAGMSIAAVEQGCQLADPRKTGLLQPLTALEADEIAPTLREACLLSNVIDFDITALAALATGAPPQICRSCACSDADPCEDASNPYGSCSWIEDDLCSACTKETSHG